MKFDRVTAGALAWAVGLGTLAAMSDAPLLAWAAWALLALAPLAGTLAGLSVERLRDRTVAARRPTSAIDDPAGRPSGWVGVLVERRH